MFFCQNCNNSYDITRNIQQKQQTGGNDSNSSDMTSTQELSSSSSKQDNYDDIIKKALGNKLEENDVSNIDFNRFIKSNHYKSLEDPEKEIVYNKIQDILPDEQKKLMESRNNVDESTNAAYFICNNCGHSRKIQSGTLIFSRTSDAISQSYDIGDYKDLIYSDILPRTRNYICHNPKCPSHKDVMKKEAIFFRNNNSFAVKYLCTTCETVF